VKEISKVVATISFLKNPIMKEVRIMIWKNGRILVLVLSLMTVLSVSVLMGVNNAADKFPSKEITIVVAFSAGGPADITTRLLAEPLSKELGVPVIVENIPEASGVKGITKVYRAEPDGYTLLHTLFPRHAQTEIVYKAPYKILDMTYLAGYLKDDMYVIVRKESPYKTYVDLMNASKKKSLNCAISGFGSMAHLCALEMKKSMGLNMEVVPFKGSAPAVIAVLGGHVDFGTDNEPSLLTHREELRPLLIFSDKRSEKFPDVPTFKENGFVVTDIHPAMGITGPPGLPAEIQRILSDALARAIKTPSFVSRINKISTHGYMSGAEFRSVGVSLYQLVNDYKDIFKKK
jgi:tripartite-type tricarboxylate transporter receptor subunit TctC